MSLGLVSPLLNRGVRSRWLASLPGAGSKMLTIDSNGDTAFQDSPTAAWGSITGTLSNQTDLQNALNAKSSLSGGTMTGAGSAGTSTLRVNAGSGSSFTQINDNGTVVIDSDTATGTFPLTLKYAGTTVASISYQGTITGGIGAFSSLSLDSGFVILDTDATNVLAQRNSTNAQTFRIYNTYTDASNYERGKIEWSSNVLRIGTEKAGTGSARALELQTDGTTRLTISSAGLFTITDALNIAVGTTTGTKIGTATTQKIGFYNKTPVVQPAAVADATDAASVITQLNLLLSRMRDLGLIAT